jgi:proteasome accessory factor C
LAKIESAVGQAQPAGVVVGLTMRESEATGRTRQVVVSALEQRRALRIRYYTASRDQITDRTVDPMRILLVEGRSYLEAWCRLAEDVRLFRLDRIDRVAVLDEPAAPPPHARPHDVSEGLFRPEPDQREAVLVVRPDARWIEEYYPVEDVTELSGGRARVRMRYSDTSWMVRLVMGQAGEVIVEQPDELAYAVMSCARQALTRADRLPAT